MPQGKKNRHATWSIYNIPGVVRAPAGSSLHHKVEIACWTNMLWRVFNPNHIAYKRYGERGITVCDEWLDFTNFLDDMGKRPSPKLSLERIDNDGPYSKDNCCWATRTQQQNNTIQVAATLITWKGQTKTLREWAVVLGKTPETLRLRFKKGWSIQRAFTQPCKVSSNHPAWNKGAKGLAHKLYTFVSPGTHFPKAAVRVPNIVQVLFLTDPIETQVAVA